MQPSTKPAPRFNLHWWLGLVLTLSVAAAPAAAPAEDFQSYAFRNDGMPYFAFKQLPLTTIKLGRDRIDVAFAPGPID